MWTWSGVKQEITTEKKNNNKRWYSKRGRSRGPLTEWPQSRLMKANERLGIPKDVIFFSVPKLKEKRFCGMRRRKTKHEINQECTMQVESWKGFGQPQSGRLCTGVRFIRLSNRNCSARKVATVHFEMRDAQKIFPFIIITMIVRFFLLVVLAVFSCSVNNKC